LVSINRPAPTAALNEPANKCFLKTSFQKPVSKSKAERAFSGTLGE
jgi:hypothetical protein